MRSFFFIVLVLFSFQLEAVVRQSDKLEEILEHADKDTLVVLDLDDVLVEPVQLLGSLHHFRHEISQTANAHVKKGIAQETAIRIAHETEMNYWIEIQKATHVRPVEVDTPNLIRNKQKEGVRIMVMTMRPSELIAATERHLRAIGVDLAIKAPTDQEVELEGAKYTAGVLYDELGMNGDKSLTLLRFLKAVGLRPNKILYVGEREDAVSSVDAALRDSQIVSLAYRYTRASIKRKNFDPKLTTIQARYFGAILPDEIARTLLKAGK